jgi:ABC-type uncharacterized transport system
MASSHEGGSPAARRTSLFDRLEANPRESVYGAFGAAVVFGILAVVLAIQYRTNNLPVTLWAFLLGLSFLVAGVWRLFGETARMPPRDFVRLQILVLGGVIGTLTVLFLGLGLSWTWWETISGGWQTWQGKEGWRLWVVLLSLVAGLAAMFMSLQFCRGDEGSSAVYRRVIYAYNSILSVWLLLLVIVVVNVIVYIPWGPLRWFNTTNYWAKSNMYGLSPRSEKILESMDQPLKVYVLLPRPDPWYPETRVLMDNSRQFAKNMQVEYLSPDLDREKITKLNDEYKFGDRRGLLLVYGKGSQVQNRFIKYTDLVEDADPRGRNREGSFKGEKALVNEVYALSEDKEKPVIYFTQGSGEPDLFDTSRGESPDKGLGLLRQRLEAGYYKVKGIQFSPIAGKKSENPDLVVASEVPEDAAVLVVAGPKEKLIEPGPTAIAKFMNPPPGPKSRKPGKMIALLDVFPAPDKSMQQTGIEGLLTQFGVEVGNNIVLHYYQADGQAPEFVQTYMNPDPDVRNRNPIASAFGDNPMRQFRVRTVTPIPSPPGAPSRYRQDPLLMVNRRLFIWPEANIAGNFIALTDEYKKRGDLQDLISQTPLPIGVAVGETAAPSSANPHAGMQGGDDTPRLVVVGDVTWVCNYFLSPQLGLPTYDLFNSMISWLRERPNNIGIDAKKRETYSFAADAELGRMVAVPAILMVVGVIGLGCGVWVVRRR